MHARRLDVPGLVVLEPRVFQDTRGGFFESYNRNVFASLAGIDPEFVQDNHSISAKGVLRGLHYQLPPSAQGKLVRVVAGAAFDVAVDIRRGSPTFGKWAGLELSAANRLQFWIPAGFAHGFVALEDGTEFLYKSTNYYDASRERCIQWNDPAIGIAWPDLGDIVLSDKDRLGRPLAEADVFEPETPAGTGGPLA